MRTIRKGREPAALTGFRAAGGSRYDDFRATAELRAALIEEQRGICCYCMSRIGPGNSRIEHWQPQQKFPVRQLDYSNLLAACGGDEGSRGQSHCDVRKGDRELSRNPAEPGHRVEEMVLYSGDGKIRSSDSRFDKELNEILGLNSPYLQANRRAVLDALLASLPKTGEIPPARLARMLRQWNGEIAPASELEPFCMVAVYWLRKKLARTHGGIE